MISPHLSVLFDSITGENQADDESKRRSGAATWMRGRSSRRVAASAQSFPSICDLCVTLKQPGTHSWVTQQHAAAGCCPQIPTCAHLEEIRAENSPRQQHTLYFSALAFHLLEFYSSFVNFLTRVFVDCHSWALSAFFSILDSRFNYQIKRS